MVIYFFMFIGGALGGYAPMLWGQGTFSFQSILGSLIGGAIGIWLGFKLTKAISG